jgi:miniconductance mechanosensitive channel
MNGGFHDSAAYGVAVFLTFLLIALLSSVAYIMANQFITKLLTQYMSHTKSRWNHALLNRRFFHKANRLIPGIVFYIFAESFNKFEALVQRGAVTYILIMSVFAINSFIDSIDDYYRTLPISKNRPIKGFLQVIKIITFIVLGIIIIATILDRSPVLLLSGIGVMSAVFRRISRAYNQSRCNSSGQTLRNSGRAPASLCLWLLSSELHKRRCNRRGQKRLGCPIFRE